MSRKKYIKNRVCFDRNSEILDMRGLYFLKNTVVTQNDFYKNYNRNLKFFTPESIPKMRKPPSSKSDNPSNSGTYQNRDTFLIEEVTIMSVESI